MIKNETIQNLAVLGASTLLAFSFAFENAQPSQKERVNPNRNVHASQIKFNHPIVLTDPTVYDSDRQVYTPNIVNQNVFELRANVLENNCDNLDECVFRADIVAKNMTSKPVYKPSFGVNSHHPGTMWFRDFKGELTNQNKDGSTDYKGVINPGEEISTTVMVKILPNVRHFHSASLAVSAYECPDQLCKPAGMGSSYMVRINPKVLASTR